MLYTFSQAHYEQEEFNALWAMLTPNDAVVFWQDGVLWAAKIPGVLEMAQTCVYALENDLLARGLNLALSRITLDELVELTETHFPQVAL